MYIFVNSVQKITKKKKLITIKEQIYIEKSENYSKNVTKGN